MIGNVWTLCGEKLAAETPFLREAASQHLEKADPEELSIGCAAVSAALKQYIYFISLFMVTGEWI